MGPLWKHEDMRLIVDDREVSKRKPSDDVNSEDRLFSLKLLQQAQYDLQQSLGN